MGLLLFALAQLAVADSGPAFRQFKDKDVVQVDPTKAYVVIRSDYVLGIELLRAVDPADRSAWEGIRLDAFAKARKKYDRDLKKYERDNNDWTNGDINDRKMIGRKPERPVEVTLETIAVTPVEMANLVTIFRKPVVAEDSSGMRTYLVQVRPGTYYLLGAAGMVGGIGTGSCFCMGTLGFTVRPDQIVDAGTIRGSSKDYFASPAYTPPTGSVSLPQLAGRAIEPAVMMPVGKIANLRSYPITRLNPVPGVLAYDRDIPLDVAKANQPIPAIR